MRRRIFYLVFAIATGLLLAGCGGGGDSSSSTGTISMNVADAKPMLPDGVEQVIIEFSEVSAHKSGGGWASLPFPQNKTSFTIDLLQFTEGNKTQFVPPVLLESGKYTQVRIGVISATLVTADGSFSMEIPSENLKTDKNFGFDVPDGGAADITVDFDLSQSIVVTGKDTYQLKPVLHIIKTSQAATIQGTINFSTTVTQATVTVISDKNGDGILQPPNPLDPSHTDEVYTSILVEGTTPTLFKVFWLVPDQGYFVQVQLSDRTYEEYVASDDLEPGETFTLKGGSAI